MRGKVIEEADADGVLVEAEDGTTHKVTVENITGKIEPEPIGVGRFGNIYDQFKGKVKDAVEFLLRRKGGEAVGALHHDNVGDISVVYGTDRYGLAHIAKKHPDVLNDLQGAIDGMVVTRQSDNRIVLESDTHRAVISKMLGNEPTSNWLLTAYEKKNPASASSSDIETEPEGKQNGTATLQNEISTEDEVSENVGEKQNIEDNSQIEGETPSPLQGTPPKQGSEGELAIPTDEKGKKLYESAPIEATINDIYNDEELDEEEADAFVQAKIDGATKRIAQLEKNKPKMGEDIQAFKAEKAKWQSNLEAEQASLAYWQGVQESKANGKLRVENGEQSVPSIESGTTTTSETATTTNITPTSENKQDVHKEPQQEETQEEGAFGKIYRQFKGKAKEAFAFLTKMKSGDALGVFTREGIGDIDLVWGDKNGGLAHIISKHVGESKSFSSVEDAQSVISDIIENGEVMFENGDKVVISKNGKIVTLRKNYREKGKKIADKNWILTAYDETKADGTSAISGINQGQAAQPTDVSTDKDTTNFRDLTEKLWRITDFLNKSYVYNFENEVDFYNWVARKLKNKKAIRKWIADKFPPHLVNEVVKTIFAYGKALAKRKQSTIGVNAVADSRGLATDAVIASLEGSGIEVVEATDAMAEAVLGMANPGVELSAKQKRALETESVQEEHQPSVVSSADGTKVLKNLDNAIAEYEEKPVKRGNTFLGDVAKAIGAKKHGSNSQYATFETVNGKVVTIRLADHNAKVSTFDNHDELDGISIVVSAKQNTGITNDGDAHVVEYYYDAIRLRKADGNPLVEILKSIKQALYSGEFTDTTGLAERQEVNLNEIETLRTPQGVVYGWTDGKKVYLTKDGMNPETPIHEYTHIWAKAMMQNNPEGWQSVKDLLRGTPIWNEVLNDPNYSGIIENEDAVASEALSRMSGKENARRMEQEARKMIDEAKGIMAKAEAVTLIERMRKALQEFWSWVGKSLFDIKEFGSIEEVTDRVLYDLVRNAELGVRNDGEIEKQIIGERGAEALDKAEEATHRMDNLAVAREMEEAFNAKIMRIEKLRASKPIMVEFNGEYELSRTSAKQWAKDNLRGRYVNADTGEGIELSKVGINEVTSHGSQDEAHLISITAIPAFIEQSIFIDEIPNTKSHDKYDSYRYYVCGAKINGEDCTVKIVIGVKGDSKYYDHRLTQIEKGTLIDNLNGLSNSVAEHQKASLIGKDSKLSAILQTNEKENARRIRLATGWERGADGKWRYEIEDLKLIEGWEVKADRVTGVKLSSVIDAKSLFDAYPELADVYVSREKLSGEKGSYDPIMDVITISSDILVGADSVLTHEIQHAIQDIEGFAKGGNLQSVKTRKDELKADARRLYEMMFETPEWGEYVRLTDRWFDHDDTSVEPRIDEINESGVLNAIRQEQERLRKKYGYDANVGKILNQPYAMDADIWNRLPEDFDDRHDAYRRLGGEVEARNAQSRMNMTAEQRRATLLSETEDVEREDQIFLMENSGVSAMGSRVEKRMAEIASLFEGRELSEEQRAVADVFGGKADNLTISVKIQDGNTHKLVMRQGNGNKAGAKHSVFRHYETASNSYTADEILLIPQIIEQGERKQEGKKVSYKMEIEGVTYSVTTEMRRGAEEFTNFYTNRKPIRKSLLNTDEQHGTTSVSVSTDKVSDKVGDVQEGGSKLTVGGVNLNGIKYTNNGRKLIATTRKGHQQIFKTVHNYAVELFGADNVDYEKAKSGSIYMTVDLPNGHYIEIRFASHTPSGYSVGELQADARNYGLHWTSINGYIGAKVDISFNSMTSKELNSLLDILNGYAQNGFPEDVVETLKANPYNHSDNDISRSIGINLTPFNEAEEEVLFRDGGAFYSNAEEAVLNIRQDKATPEQWLAMIQKNGGLKVGEDKWLGLSEWLTEKGKSKDERGKSLVLTKQEVLEFINQNKIEIEEVNYSTDEALSFVQSEFDELTEVLGGYGEAFDEMANRYGDDFKTAIWYDEVGQLHFEDGYEDYGNYISDYHGINETRLNYTTDFLDNKREIALVVPTIDPYNAHDEIHFGDAGGGRAVAWVRFGETTDAEGNRVLVIDEIQSKRHQDGREKGYIPTIEKQIALAEDTYNDAKNKYEEAVSRHSSFNENLLSKYGIGFEGITDAELQELRTAYENLKLAEETLRIKKDALVRVSNGERGKGVPDAPFEKNWHELAMKRMLRYAAENGYDKVAWTTGEQQAERYDLSTVVESIDYRMDTDGTILIDTYGSHGYQIESVPTHFKNEAEIAEVFGKEIANTIVLNLNAQQEKVEALNQKLRGLKPKMKEVDVDSVEYDNLVLEFGEISREKHEAQKMQTIEGEDLRIGGEGMKGFYDKMLPSFMNKYGKKWGVKVGEVELPDVGDNGLTMHSIDVTDAMKESVMEGQPMFREREEIPRLNKYRVEKIFGGIWIEDVEEFAKFASAVNNYSFEEKGEGIAYTDNYFYAYYRNIDGQVVPYASVYLNEAESQDVINKINQELNNGRKREGIRQYFDRVVVRARSSKGAHNANNGNNQGSSSSAENDRLGGGLLRKGKYYDSPSLYVKTERVDDVAERSGDGAYTDAEVSVANDPVAKVMGKSQLTKAQQAKFAERERKAMRNRVSELTEKMGIGDRVVVVESGELRVESGISQRKARAKGWFDPRTGKIVINLSNHVSVADVERTLLHEAVAHYGLRELFGGQFDTFLDNVYNNAEGEIKAQIDAIASSKGVSTRVATEEYLAGLAEDTNFEYLERQTSFWQKLKQLFMDMLESIGWDYKGPELSDNELRYILWRSYENMVNPGRHRSILGMAEDVVMRERLGIGTPRVTTPVSQVAESAEVYSETPTAEEAVAAYKAQFDNVGEVESLKNEDAFVEYLKREHGFDGEDITAALEDMEDSPAVYDKKKDKILIFAWKNQNVYFNLIHEHCHKATDKLGGADKFHELTQELKEFDPKLWVAIKECYEENAEDEMLAYVMQYVISTDLVSEIKQLLTPESQMQLSEIINYIGYGKDKNIGQRVERFNTRETEADVKFYLETNRECHQTKNRKN